MHRIKAGVAQLSNGPSVDQAAGVLPDVWLDGGWRQQPNMDG
jgi:hypothetical protein